ncbi:MAG: deoxyribose-phosphate aldolase [Lachnospiraceae bacterium]|nr:deoxyribose-phosphate aldolase [Lachnospiraceae bacterium]
MEVKEILSHVDHTELKAFATWEQIKKLCEEHLKYATASVCVPPTYIKRINEEFNGKVNICTVIGFPLGYQVTSAKVEEARAAIADGASEIDTVINVSDVKNGRYDEVEKELLAIREATKGKVLKVIIETCYLTEEEKIKMCEIVTRTKADYIKTSTGFGTAGATIEDIKLFKSHIGPDVKMKAAGGIRTREDMEAYLALGVDRLGCSAAMKLVEE